MPERPSDDDLTKSERPGTGWGGEAAPNTFDRGGSEPDEIPRGYRMLTNDEPTKNASAGRIREV